MIPQIHPWLEGLLVMQLSSSWLLQLPRSLGEENYCNIKRQLVFLVWGGRVLQLVWISRDSIIAYFVKLL